MQFSTPDFIVFGLYLLLIAGVGIYFSKSQNSVKDYFLGGRTIPWFTACMSIVATETSTLTFIGIPAISFGGNMTFIQLAFGYFCARVIVSFVFLPTYFNNDFYTPYSLLNREIGTHTRRLSSAVFMVTRLLADGVRLFATAIPLSLVSGLSYTESIAIVTVVTLLYTLLGGLKAVVWLDALQLVVYIFGGLLTVYLISNHLPDGFAGIVQTGASSGKLTWLNFDLNLKTTYTIFSGLIGGIFLGIGSHGTDQLIVQRLLACKDLRAGQKALIASGFIIIFQFALFLFIGIMLFAFYQHYPEKLNISRPDEIFPLYIAREMPAGVTGLLVAGIFAAAMSTLSSTLNSLSSTTVLDWLKPILKDKWQEINQMATARIVTILWGILLVGVATFANHSTNVLETGLSIASFTYGSLVGIFLLLFIMKTISDKASVLSMSLGIIAMIFIGSLGVAWPWFVFIGSTITFAIGYILRSIPSLK